MFRKISLLVATVFAASLLSMQPVTVSAQKAYRAGGMDAPTSDGGVALEAFAKAVGELSKGKMKIEKFHSAKLGPHPEQVRNVKSGAQSMMLVWTSFLASQYPQAKFIGLPYVFLSFKHLQAFYKSDLFKPTVDALAKDGAVFLDNEWTWWRQDPRGFISVRPVITPAEMNNLKMRIWESKPAISTWQGFGANTIVVPRAEMYLAFKQGIIEGGPETIGIAYDQKNVEMGKYFIQTQEYYQIINILMNKKQFDALSSDELRILRAGVKVGGEALRAESLRGFEVKKTKAMDEYGVSIIQPALGPWRKAGLKTIKKLEDDGFIPKGFVAKIQALKY